MRLVILYFLYHIAESYCHLHTVIHVYLKLMNLNTRIIISRVPFITYGMIIIVKHKCNSTLIILYKIHIIRFKIPYSQSTLIQLSHAPLPYSNLIQYSHTPFSYSTVIFYSHTPLSYDTMLILPSDSCDLDPWKLFRLRLWPGMKSMLSRVVEGVPYTGRGPGNGNATGFVGCVDNILCINIILMFCNVCIQVNGG